MSIAPLFLEDQWRAKALMSRLRAVEEEDHHHSLTQRSADEPLWSGIEEAAPEAREMARTAT